MSWDIISDAITLIGCVIALGTVLYKLSVVLTKLDISVTHLTERIGTFEKEADSEHRRLENKIDDNSDTLSNHETRIHDLERERSFYNENS